MVIDQKPCGAYRPIVLAAYLRSGIPTLNDLGPIGALRKLIGIPDSLAMNHRADPIWVSWTKLCERASLERSFGDAEEEIQRGADRGDAPSDLSVDVAEKGCTGGLP